VITPSSGEISNLCLPRTFFSSHDISPTLFPKTRVWRLSFSERNQKGKSRLERLLGKGGYDRNGGDCSDLALKGKTEWKWVEISERSVRFESREKREEGKMWYQRK
jgi:hypothetical protein